LCELDSNRVTDSLSAIVVVVAVGLAYIREDNSLFHSDMSGENVNVSLQPH
jgi:hypothetical protein